MAIVLGGSCPGGYQACGVRFAESRAIPCRFSGSGQVALSNFPEIVLKLSLPHMMNICKIWMKSVKKWH